MTALKPFRALALDGGGVRGLYTATLLHTLATRFAGVDAEIDIGKSFDLVAGTSTGALLALALASGVQLSDVIRLYREHGPLIFTDPMPSTRFKRLRWMVRNRQKAANSQAPLRSSLERVFRSETLGELYARRKIAVCIPAVNAGTHSAWVFKTPHVPGKTRDDRFKIVDVCMATSAAPFFLPLARIENPDSPKSLVAFADGGLWANNPVLVALLEALELAQADQPIEVISVGTSGVTAATPVSSEREANRGVLDWKGGTGALEMSLDAQAIGTHSMAVKLAAVLSGCGRPCKITRLPQSTPSLEQGRSLGLDRADQAALQTLADLGSSDANSLHGKILRGGEEFANLLQVFRSH